VQWLESYLRVKMEKSNVKLLYILQYYYDKGKNATREKICAVYGEGTLSKSTARKWFARFRSGNYEVKDEHALVVQSLKKLKKFLKRSSKISISAVSILV